MRDMLFVSHANPEDNEFARWLALRLAAEGYGVWCDLTKLLGGETWWDDIEDAIRHRTAKFIYVLSRTSNEKAGPRNELALARTVERADRSLERFIIPVWIDDLAPADFNVEVHRINAIPFRGGWATGFAHLLERLVEDRVPKKAGFDSTSVSRWWRNHMAGERVVERRPELLATNWFPLRETTIYFHELRRSSVGKIALPENLRYPAVQHDQFLVAFAPAADFVDKLGADTTIVNTLTRTINAEESSAEPRLWSYKDQRRHLTNLLRQAWARLVDSRGLATVGFANNARAFYYREGAFKNDTIWFPDLCGGKGRRQVVGYKTIKGPDGYPKGRRSWHFAVEAKPSSHPEVGYTMRSHVVFSDDGKAIWENHERSLRARRSQCKNWWNDDWCDRILAMVHSLSSDGVIRIPVGEDTVVELKSAPIMLESPVSYDEKWAVQAYPDIEDETDEFEIDDTPALPAPAVLSQYPSAEGA